MSLNDLTVSIYTGLGATIRPDVADDLQLATVDRFTKIFPGGLYMDASLYIPRPVTTPFLWQGADRVVLRNGLKIVWEGTLADIGYTLGAGAEQGITLDCIGAWGNVLGQYTMDKRWADNRVSDDIWVTDTSATATGLEKMNEDRSGRIFITPNDGEFSSSHLYAIGYTMPTGQLIKRLTCDYDVSETAIVSPAIIFFLDDADNTRVFTEQPNLVDGDPSVGSTPTLTTDDYWYMKIPDIDEMEVDAVRINVGVSVNNNAATLTMQRYIGQPQNVTPVSVRHDNGGAFTTLTNTFDGNTGSSSTVTITSDDFLYVLASEAQVMGIRVDMGATVNAVECNVRVQRYDVDDAQWVNVSTDENQTEVKGTNNMIPFAQDGNILWNPDAATSAVAINGTTGMWWRLTFSDDLTASIVINEIYILSGWETVAISDGTASGGAPLAVDGDITFTYANTLEDLRVNDVTGKWIRFSTSANLDAVTVNEVQLLARQAWEFRIRDRVGNVNWASITTTTTGSVDHSPGTPRQTVYLEFKSRDKQLAVGNGTVYVELTNLMVYSETGNINLTEIATDVVGAFSSLNSTVAQIGSNTYALAPFYTEGREYITDILSRAASFGDGSQNAWGVCVVDSEQAATSNGEPVLKAMQVPALTDYDYAVRVDEENLVPPLALSRDFTGVFNWVTVQYQDVNGRDVLITPDDDATLKDTASITAYGERHSPTLSTNGNSATALNLGKRFLANYKTPRWIMTSPLQVVDYIRAKSGNLVPASEIEPGKRVRIENFLQDLAGVDGGGLVFLITQTDHSEGGRVCSISAGIPDHLAAFLAQMTREKAVHQNLAPSDGRLI